MNRYFEVYSIINDLGNMFSIFSILSNISSVSLKLVCSVVEIEQLHLLTFEVVSS